MVDKYGSWTVNELKTELRSRNAKCVGKKEALIERLAAYDRNNNFKESDNFITKDENDIVGLTWPPDESFVSVKKSNVVPKMDIVHITHYFLQVYKEQEGMTMHAAVHRKGYNMMKENFLTALVVSNFMECFFYRAQVNSEMTKSLTYFVKVVINQEGNIIEGSCECIAGKGTQAVCKHVATVSYAILHFREHGTWCIRKTCTDLKQTWHMPKRSKVEVSPKKAEQLNLSVSIYNVKKKEMYNMCYDPRPNEYRNSPSFNDNVRNAVINYNSTKKRTLALSGAFTAASTAGLINDHDYLSKPLAHQFIWNRIQGSTEALLALEKKTRAQYNSPMWFIERSLRITASNVGTIVHMTERKNKNLFTDSIINPKKFKSKATEWGKLNEKNAIAAYKNATTNNVVPCGLFVAPEHCFLAGSPDGLVCSLTVLEVKCPYTIREQDITADSVEYLEMVDNMLNLKQSSNYYYQVQTQMCVTGRKFCDFCVWTKKDFRIISVVRNDDVINNLIIPKTRQFYNEFIVPALVKKFYSV